MPAGQAVQDAVREFFTLGSLGTFMGASTAVTAVYVLTNTFRVLVNSTSPRVPFVLSLIVALVAAGSSGALQDVWSVAITVLNGCLLFLTALGAQAGVSRGEAHPPPPGGAVVHGKPSGGAVVHGKPSVRWKTPWL